MDARQLRRVGEVFILREPEFDGFYIDAEHGVFSLREIADMCLIAQACGTSAQERGVHDRHERFNQAYMTGAGGTYISEQIPWAPGS
jgi:hypothetical protein